MRRVLFQVHLWCGLILCLPLVVLAVSGSILVYRQPLMELENPKLYRAGAGQAQPAVAIVAAAEKAAPAGMRAGMVFLPGDAGDPAMVRVSPAPQRGAQGAPAQPVAGPGQFLFVYLDPASLEVLGTRALNDGVLRAIHNLHGNLWIPGRDGRVIVGWLGVVMLVLGFSGLVLWWPRGRSWWAAFTIKRGAKGLRFNRDLHGAVGIWGWLVFILVSFSGVYLVFPQPVGDAITVLFPARDLRNTANQVRVEPVRGAERMDIDGAVEIARAARPGAAVRSIMLPQRPDQPYRVNLAAPGDAQGAPMITAFVDPWQRKLVELRDPKDFSVGETVLGWQRALHEGSGLGPVYRLLVFLCGLMPAVFVVTGLYMWWVKRRVKRAARLLGKSPTALSEAAASSD